MKKVVIEWKHLDLSGETCDRCYDTGENLVSEIKRLNRSLKNQDVEVELNEIKLDDKQVSQSNTIFFNGVPIEEILDIQVSNNFCASCTDLIGSETYCRTVMYEGNEYEDIPAKAIRHAVHKVLGNEEEISEPTQKADCGCNCSGCC